MCVRAWQGQELTVRQMALLAFRDLVLLKLRLAEPLGTAASVPPAVTQMLLVLQVNLCLFTPESLWAQYCQHLTSVRVRAGGVAV